MVKESGDLPPYDGFYRYEVGRNGFGHRVEAKRLINICYSPVTALILHESKSDSRRCQEQIKFTVFYFPTFYLPM
jgi:hypothetical protein